ncbi:SMP-30/gluconolactonase/LRE family protein [Streptomyces paludis]|uniref:SMP-30/gluconolactonase/LRE family protein n=1 Tax=Streptomyces paludis TaxID=2282738 RepID=A0A345HIF5_9ACTN|nr:SMP-30/gluconolactonase/LRE family protein [Streptomyces paludis]AXG76479.1 SMP-30/gluconolactonase/LRE family protein [Streptomyces paludis]
MRAEDWTGVVTYHGEGPGWDPHIGRLRAVDMLAGDILTFDGAGVPERLHVGEVAAAWRPRVSGGLVAAVERGFALIAPDGTVSTGAELWSDQSVRMNEGGCDPAGNFYCGSMAYDIRPGAGTVYRLTPGGDISVAHTGVTISNGLAWAPDGTFAYYVDTPTHSIARVTVDPGTGRFATPEPWVTIDPADGAPDGITLDAEGGVWVALWGGSAVRRYAADGALDAVVEVDARQVSACAFGGDDYRRLFITTSRQDLPDGEDPAAGAVFTVEPGIGGVAPLPYAG